MKKIVFTYLRNVILLLAAVAVFNLVVDKPKAFDIFHRSTLKEAALWLLSGKMVAGFRNYDERLFQRFVIKNIPEIPKAIAIGSSRMMYLRADFLNLPMDEFFNHSMAGDTLQDQMALLSVYFFERKQLPKIVILGMEPWYFNKNSEQQDRWVALSSDYQKLVSVVGGRQPERQWTSTAKKWLELINLEFTEANYRYLEDRLRGRNLEDRLYVTPTADIDDGIKRRDGSFIFPYAQRFQDDEAAAALIHQQIVTARPEGIEHLHRFDELTDVDLFQKFVQWLTAKGVQVVFAFIPVAPSSYREMEDGPLYKRVFEADTWLHDFASRMGIKIVGSFNPAKFGLRDEDFQDYIHPREWVVKRIFSESGL